MSTPLIIAAHGTRNAEGEAVCKALTERVGRILDGVDVSVGFVELSEPGIPRALADAVKRTGSRSAVVVPLMLGTGGHVRVDIPEFIQEALDEVPHASVRYARHLGPDPRLVGAVRERMAAARGDWQAADTTLVFLGRGALVPRPTPITCAWRGCITKRAAGVTWSIASSRSPSPACPRGSIAPMPTAPVRFS